MKRSLPLLFFVMLVCRMSVPVYAVPAEGIQLDSHTFGEIKARTIGPAVMSGRITVIDAVHANPNIVVVGTASGGVWKSTNGGLRYKPVFDDHTQSIGFLAIDQAHPDTVWVGTGETPVRNSVSVGTGIYRTADGGESWEKLGLENTERIADIIIHPENSDVVYVAAMGHLWDANEERGVYKTTDAGKSWEKILYVDENTGCADLAIDPQEPDILYAAMWEFRRWPYFFKSGGPGSGLYKTLDGGKKWKKLTRDLPDGELGRIAVAVAPSRSSVLYISVEAEEKKSGFFRSDDFGESWERMSTQNNLLYRPFYFSYIVVDPVDYNRVYKTAYNLMVSSDAGKTFRTVGGGVHPDYHAIWIDPNNAMHVLVGTDGGVYESVDQSNSFRMMRNLPVSQFYRVSVDMQKPYNVYGGLQDNGSWFGPSKSPNGIENKDWQNVGGGDGFAIFADPMNPDIIYTEYQRGNISRVHLSRNESKDIKPQPMAGDPEYRFNWNTPIALSPTNPRRLYIGAQFLFRSTDRGESWAKISPDLTTDDPEKQKQEETGGLSIDNSGAENHCTIFTLCESPLDEAVLWAGTDDGNLQLTVDDGQSWTNTAGNIPGLPSATWCSCVEAGHFAPGTAYATFDGHRTGDMAVYVYKTTDYGKTWTSIATDAIEGYAHVIREDLKNPDLLFVGTEFGLFITVDGGRQWARFTGDFPPVPVKDMVIHPRESDLVIATHGRGFYIVDDITPLRTITDDVLESDVSFLESKPTIISQLASYMNYQGSDEFVGSNPSEVAKITYYMKKRHIFGDMRIEIYDPDGELIKSLPGGKRRGINRVLWQMRLKPPKVAPSPVMAGGAMFGPMVPEGTYKVKLVKGNKAYETELQIMADPDSPHSAEDRKLQSETVWKLFDMQSRLAYVSEAIQDVKKQAEERAGKLKENDRVRKSLEAFAERMDELNKSIVATRTGGITGEVKLREQVVGLYASVSRYTGRPTQTHLDRIPYLEKKIEKANADFESILSEDLDRINRRLESKKLDPVKVITKEEWDKKQEEN